MANFVRISCSCPDIKNRKGRSNFLGSVQIDVANTAHFHCKTCTTTWEISVTESGSVTRSRVKKEIPYLKSVAIIEVE